MHLEMKCWQGAGAGGGGRRQAEAQAGSNTRNENPLGGTVPAVLYCSPQHGQEHRGTPRQSEVGGGFPRGG